MNKRKTGILLIVTMIVTGLPWVNISYAAEENDILVEALEMEESDDVVIQTGEAANGVVSETYMTTPDSDEPTHSEEETKRPDGVISMTFKTVSNNEGNTEDADHDSGVGMNDAAEVTGRSSMPDPSELGMYAEDVVNMVMPVISDETYDFVMDSGNLLSRFSENKDYYAPASIYFNNTTGEKSHTEISDVAMAKNKSSVPVLLYVSFQVENDYGWDVNYTDMDSVEEDEGKNVSFAIIPVSENRIEGDAKDSGGTDEEMLTGEDDRYILLKDKMVNIDENGKAEMILYIPGTVDNFDVIEDKYIAKEDAVWSSLGFAITGACNTKADWSDMDKRAAMGESIGIHISYRMDTLSEEQKAWIEEGYTPDPESGVIVFDMPE